MPNKITVTIEGGLIHDVSGVPHGYVIEFRDYDIEGYDEDILETDEYGDEYHPIIFGPDVEADLPE